VPRGAGSGTDRGGGGHRRTRVKALPRIYNNFHGFKEAPFSLTPDPRFLSFSDKHREALNQMAFGINEGKGFIQISGEVGSGKTTICRTIHELEGDYI